ncbi:hypothetical protein [Nesterenkonia sp. Act20]|uniref:hypothetical protein n=1 Tax=Nesterenkonia sp. Act20 TaxID=1483432 RepID=UPI001C4641C7|nr:hypothetical protein [Nesterenkonia sp. Act20]
MSSSADDEIRFIKESHRLLSTHVGSTLLSRGWVATDLDDDEDLEWFWRPTAPLNYRGHPEWIPPAVRIRPQMHPGPRRTPWILPTRITAAGGSWKVSYGEAVAQKPKRPHRYRDEGSLLADLERIEWWPMTVKEARRIQAERVLSVATAWAYDNHHIGCEVTEPYGSRMEEISAQRQLPREQQRRGNLDAQYFLVDAQAWASAQRTTRAGGRKWGRDS